MSGDGVRAGTYLGERFLGEGGNLLEPMVGAWLLKRVRDKAAEEQHPTPPGSRAPHGELVLIVAAAALYNKRQGEYLLTPRRATRNSKRGWRRSARPRKASGFPNRAHVAASERIWAAMLDGAQAGEAQKRARSIARSQSTAQRRMISDLRNKIAHAIDNVARALDELR